jgi:hypothetical protein
MPRVGLSPMCVGTDSDSQQTTPLLYEKPPFALTRSGI